jgi:hypothetical protein
MTALEGRATDVLQGVLKGETYEETLKVATEWVYIFRVA